MDGLVGILKVRVVRGINLAYRDARGSDPYVVLRLGKQVWHLHCSRFLIVFPDLNRIAESEDKCEEEIREPYLA
jgi:hypothetical protein